MKRFTTFLLLAFSTMGLLSAQNNNCPEQYSWVDTLMTGNTTAQAFPFGTSSTLNYYRCTTWSIYTRAELEALGITPGSLIREIGYSMSTAQDYIAPNLTIYLKEVPAKRLTHTSDSVSLSEMTPVFSRQQQTFSQGWTYLTLDSTYTYSGSGNLMIAVHRDSIASSGQFRFHQISGSSIMRNSNPTNYPTIHSYLSTSIRPAIAFRACAAPYNYQQPQITAIRNTSTSVQVQLAPIDSVCQVVIGTPGFDPDTISAGYPWLQYVQADSVRFDSLAHWTSYDIYVRSRYGDIYTLWSGPVATSTHCQPPLPYIVDPTGTTTDSCWVLHNVTAGDNGIWSTDTNLSIAVLPDLHFPVSHAHFEYTISPQPGQIMEVGVVTNAYNPATFLPYDTLDASSGSIDFNRWNGPQGRLALRFRQGAIQHVEVDSVYGCYTPDSLLVALQPDGSVRASWQNNSLECSSFRYICRPYHDSSFTSLYTDTNYCIVDSLTPRSWYTFGVQSLCAADRTSEYVWHHFCSACLPISQLPYTIGTTDLGPNSEEAFDAPCWSRIDHTNGYTYWVSPLIDTTQIRMDHLKITLAATYDNPDYSNIAVGLVDSAANLGSYSQLGTVALQHGASNSSTGLRTLYSSLRQGRRLVLRSLTGTVTHIDTVILEESRCHPISNITLVGNSDTTLTINWTERGNASQWLVEWAPVNGGTTQQATTSSRPYTISGLSAHTTYQVTIRALHEGDTSLPASRQFATVPASFHAYSLFQIGTPNGSNYHGLPVRRNEKHTWQQIIYPLSQYAPAGWIDTVWFHCLVKFTGSGRLDTSLTLYMGHTADPASSNTEFMPAADLTPVYHDSTWLAGANNQWVPIALQTPYFYNGIDNLVLVFSHSNSGERGSGDYYSYNTSSMGSSIYTGSSNAYSAQAPDSSISRNMTNRRPVVRFSMYTSTCQSITHLQIAGQQDDSVTLTWQEHGSASQWQVKYVATDSSHTGTQLVSGTPIATLGGLHSNRTYRFYVRPICGDGDTGYYAGNVSATIITCAAPDSLTDTQLTESSVTLAWRENGSATSWEVRYQEQSADPTVAPHTGSIISSSNPCLLSGLHDRTDYQITVRAICGAADSSMWSSPLTITTPRGAYDRDEVQIGTIGTTSGYSTPFDGYWKHSWTQMIYTAQQIGTFGYIDTLWFCAQHVGSTAPADTSVTIYMAHIDHAVHSASHFFLADSLLYEVYHASVAQPTDTGWFALPLDAPFAYNGTDNLAIAVSYHASQYSNQWTYYYNQADSSVLIRFNDYDVSYGNPPTVDTTDHTNILPMLPVIRLSMSGDMSFCSRPHPISLDQVGADSIQLHWQAGPNDSLYLGQYRSDDGTDSGSFVCTDTLYTIGNLQQLTSYRIELRALCTSGDTSAFSFLNATTLERCPSPTSLRLLDTLRAEAVTVSWRPVGDAAQWQVAYHTAPTGTLLTLPATTDTFYTLPPLVAGQQYKVFVRSICGAGDTGFWSSPVTFTAGHWTTISNRCDTLYSCNTLITSHDAVGNDTLVIYPGTPGNLVALSGTLQSSPYINNYVTTLRVYDGAGVDGVLIGTYSGDTTLPQLVSTHGALTLEVSHPYAYATLQLHATCLADNGCHASSQMSYERPLDNTVGLHWRYDDPLPASFEVAYAPYGQLDTADASSFTVVSGITDTAYQLGGLTPGTRYQAAVRTVCGQQQYSRWTLSGDFYTTCSAIPRTALPFSEDFSTWGSGSLTFLNPFNIPCWYYNTNKDSGTRCPSIHYDSDDPMAHYIELDHYGYTYDALVLPLFDDSIRDLTINFYVQNGYTGAYNQYVEVVEVGVMDDPRDFSTYTAISRDSLVGENWQHLTKHFNSYEGHGRYIAIVAPMLSAYHSGYALNIAGVEVLIDMPCMPPLSLEVDSVSFTEALLSINDTSSTSGYEVVYGTAGVLSQASDTLLTGTNEAHLTGLTPGTQYWAWVRGHKQVDQTAYASAWTGPVTFTTGRLYHADAGVEPAESGSVTIVPVEGEVSPDGYYPEGTVLRYTALYNPSYEFIGWGDSVADEQRLVTLTQDTLLTALFQSCGAVEGADSEQIVLAPNPATDHVALLTSTPVEWVDCYDMRGRLMGRYAGGTDRVELPVAQWPAGSYIIKIQTPQGPVVRKLIVR